MLRRAANQSLSQHTPPLARARPSQDSSCYSAREGKFLSPKRLRFCTYAAALLLGFPVAHHASGQNVTSPNVSEQVPDDWGDHVGQPWPPYVTGDECLFCHRELGSTWHENPHQLTLRPADPGDPAIKTLQASNSAMAAEVHYLLGSQRHVRFLRRSKSYGKLDLLNRSFSPSSNKLQVSDAPQVDDGNLYWDSMSFGQRCAGCHATAVDASSRSFSSLSIDCFACHGDVPLDHANDVSQVLLSSRNTKPLHVTSICGQCHLRGGKSKSTALPYPNTFVAGDNLLRDFQVPFDEATIASLPAVDQHVYLNAKQVAVLKDVSVTCLSCHDVHGKNSLKHQELDYSADCSSCHTSETDLSELKQPWQIDDRLRAHSRTCEY